jgi:hypothetical protein
VVEGAKLAWRHKGVFSFAQISSTMDRSGVIDLTNDDNNSSNVNGEDIVKVVKRVEQKLKEDKFFVFKVHHWTSHHCSAY